jgi:DNA-binding transcriptional ArsR family regulator
VRLRDIAAIVGVTERTAYGIVTDLTEAGYVVKHKDGRRNRYQIQAHLPLLETDSRKRTIGEILALLTGGDGDTRDGALRRIRRLGAIAEGATGSGLQMPQDL